MIHLSRIHDAGVVVVNADLIETIEACPDTTITLLTKRKFVVAEPLDVVIERILAFRRSINERFSAELPAQHNQPGALVAANPEITRKAA